MSLIEIHTVDVRQPDSRMLGWNIDSPVPGEGSDTYAIDIHAWALSKEAPVASLDILVQGQVIRSVPATVSRPDLRAAFPVNARNVNGFATSISLLGLGNPPFKLEVFVSLDGGTRLPMATIEGVRKPIRSAFEPRATPLLLTTFGRTGSTWVSYLLSMHPSITSYPQFPYETRVYTYWASVILELTDPGNYSKVMHPPLNPGAKAWWLHEVTTLQPQVASIATTLGTTQVELLVSTAQQAIDNVVRAMNGVSPDDHTLCLEKSPPGRVPALLHEIYPRAKEILLVRDLRDLICSALSYNHAQGMVSFNRELVDSDEAYIRKMRETGLALQRELAWRGDHMHLVRYEDMMLNPTATLKGLLDYLQLEATVEVVAAMLAKAAVDTPEMASHRTTASGQSSVGRWRTDMTEEQKAIAAESLADVLETFGYEVH